MYKILSKIYRRIIYQNNIFFLNFEPDQFPLFERFTSDRVFSKLITILIDTGKTYLVNFPFSEHLRVTLFIYLLYYLFVLK